MTDRPIGIDLFAGAGGLSLGFEQAGFNIAAAVEIDPIHAAVHHFNFPRTTMIPGSVIGLSGAEIRAAAGIGSRSVQVVFGGAPCQGFSLIGQRLLDDPRNHLVKEFVRIVTELNAETFVFENVKGLTLGNHRQFLQAVVEAFHSAGYKVRLPWRVLNAEEFGVPQSRERLFLLGARNDLPLPEYPDPITSIAVRPLGGTALARTPTCAEAIGDIPDAELFSDLLASDTARVSGWSARSPFARDCRCETAQAWHNGHRRSWETNDLTASTRTSHTEISRRRFAATVPGDVEPISRFFKLHPDGVCNTLRAGTDSARGAFTSPRPIHYALPRCITVREMARLHGYPDWFRFHVTKWHGARQVGNSVPPPLARSVASQIMATLGLDPVQPSATIALGNPMLLGLDMRKAAAFWSVPVPIGRRDRKSGSRKRRQSDIEASMDLNSAVS